MGRLKRDIAKLVAKCLNCQQVKVEQQNPNGFLQEIQVSFSKWEDIHMDLMVGLP